MFIMDEKDKTKTRKMTRKVQPVVIDDTEEPTSLESVTTVNVEDTVLPVIEEVKASSADLVESVEESVEEKTYEVDVVSNQPVISESNEVVEEVKEDKKEENITQEVEQAVEDSRSVLEIVKEEIELEEKNKTTDATLDSDVAENVEEKVEEIKESNDIVNVASLNAETVNEALSQEDVEEEKEEVEEIDPNQLTLDDMAKQMDENKDETQKVEEVDPDQLTLDEASTNTNVDPDIDNTESLSNEEKTEEETNTQDVYVAPFVSIGNLSDEEKLCICEVYDSILDDSNVLKFRILGESDLISSDKPVLNSLFSGLHDDMVCKVANKAKSLMRSKLDLDVFKQYIYETDFDVQTQQSSRFETGRKNSLENTVIFGESVEQVIIGQKRKERKIPNCKVPVLPIMHVTKIQFGDNLYYIKDNVIYLSEYQYETFVELVAHRLRVETGKTITDIKDDQTLKRTLWNMLIARGDRQFTAVNPNGFYSSVSDYCNYEKKYPIILDDNEWDNKEIITFDNRTSFEGSTKQKALVKQIKK